MNYINFNKKILESAIKKLNFKVFLTAIIDFIFYAASISTMLFWNSELIKRYNAVNLPPLSQMDDASLLTALIQTQSLYNFIIYSLILLAVLLFVYSVFAKSIIWALATNTKITKKYILRFGAVKLVWNAAAVLMIVLIFKILEFNAALSGTLLIGAIFIYLSTIIYPLLAKSQRLSAIRKGLMIGVKIHMTALPYIIIILFGFIVRYVFSLSRSLYWQIPAGFIVLIYFAVSRHYISSLVLGLEKDL